MRIGIDCRIFGSRFTGIGRYTHELVRNIITLNKKLPHPHELILFFNNPEFQKFKTSKYVKKVLVDAGHYSIAEQTKFLKFLNKENLDLVHFTHFNVPLLYRRPYVVTIHDLTLSLFPNRKITKIHNRIGYHLAIKNATRTAKKVIAISENTKKDLVKLLKVPAKKITVIYNGVDSSFKSAIGKPANKSTKTPFLLYSGVWRGHKNLSRLIEAFYILKKDKKISLKLIITGKPDPKFPEVKNSVKKFKLQKEVIFTGHIMEKELIKLYQSAQLFVFPSLYEGFGLPLLEAMKSGTPVVASNASSIPEICGKSNAIFFDPYDVKDIADKIYKVYKNKALQKRLIVRGFAHSEKFSWKRTAEKTFEIILKCLNRSKNS